MASPLEPLARSLKELPDAQRRLLVPLFAQALLDQAPDGVEMPEELRLEVEAFWQSFGPGSVEDRAAMVEARLREAGVSLSLLDGLSFEAWLTLEAEDARQGRGLVS